MGEFGAMNKENTSARVEWAKYYTEYARSKNIPCFWWDNGITSGEGERFGLLNRTTNGFIYPELVSAITGATVSADPYVSTTILILSPNAPWGWQRMYEIDSLPNGAKITQGTQYTFTYSFKSNIAMDKLDIVLVDNSAAVNYWNELSGYYLLHENIEPDTVLSGTVTLTASKTASSATVTANKLAFGSGNGTLRSPTLTFDVFKFE
jgi:hypothetical protein